MCVCVCVYVCLCVRTSVRENFRKRKVLKKITRIIRDPTKTRVITNCLKFIDVLVTLMSDRKKKKDNRII